MFPEDIEAALEKLDLPDFDWARHYTIEEVLYLLDHCPFLQIVCSGEAKTLAEPEFITAPSGWKIHYYGDAMSSSPGELLFAGGDYRLLFDDADDEDGDGGLINPSKGTIVKQAFDTAAAMIQYAQKMQWRGVQIVDGHPLMLWAAWMQATDDRFPLKGYTPTVEDKEKRERVKRSTLADQGLVDRKLLRR